MSVHLTSANSTNKTDGTQISSKNQNLASAMRISFTVGNQVYVYDPGMGAKSYTSNKVKTFGLASSKNMVLSDDNALFYLTENVDKPVVVHIWLEGTDANCTDALKGADYSIALRFVGTDKQNKILDGDK
jgi:hypothetical protein